MCGTFVCVRKSVCMRLFVLAERNKLAGVIDPFRSDGKSTFFLLLLPLLLFAAFFRCVC